jgi:hypothetical protein
LKRVATVAAGYSGAEIEQAVVASLFRAFHDGPRELTTDDLVASVKASVPLSVTMREGIQRLRDWADTRARPASSAEVPDLDSVEFAREYDERIASHKTDTVDKPPRLEKAGPSITVKPPVVEKPGPKVAEPGPVVMSPAPSLSNKPPTTEVAPESAPTASKEAPPSEYAIAEEDASEEETPATSGEDGTAKP